MPIKNKITIVMAYYENGGMLDRHLSEWASYPDEYKRHFKAIIVDDGSPIDPAEPHLINQQAGFPIELYRIGVDIPWNQNGARNLGMKYADGWCLMTDMDLLLEKDMVLPVIRMASHKPFRYFIPARKRAVDGKPYKRHPNSYIIHRDLFWRAGGYDESFCGYYGTDSTFRNRLAQFGERIEVDDIVLTLFGREVIPDASTTAYGRKDSKYYLPNNPALVERKRAGLPPIKPLNFPWERVL